MRQGGMISRRFLLAAGASAWALPIAAQTLAAQELELVEGGKDQTAVLQAAINDAAARGRPFVFPSGTFVTGRLRLPKGAHLVGRPGRTVLALSGPGPLIEAGDAGRITLEGLTLDGIVQPLAEDAGLLNARDVADLRIDDCVFRNSGGDGLRLERCGGRIERCVITGAARAALFANDSTGLSITGNTVEGCLDNGILIWRSAKGDDGTIVTENRITGIGARSGGTGQYGNAINLYRAGGVIVSGNQIRQCRFSAIRNNGGSNVQITGNTCMGFEESAIWHEFDFEGGIVNGNIVDGAMIGVLVVNLGSHNGRLAAVSGNIVRNCTRRAHIGDGETGGGIGIKAEGEIAITGNVIDACDHAGIEIGWGEFLKGAVVANNYIKAPNIGIAVSIAPGTGDATISGNAIAGARLPIAGTKWSEIATGDLTADASAYPKLRISGNTVSKG
jgi:uncharacterized secreted repeat protein (TIGR03808 family)